MKKNNLMTLIFASVGMLVLIFDGKTAVYGIRCGIDICLRTLIPSLFPFFVISGLITSSVIGQSFDFLRPIGKICRIPEGSESLLVIGILGGYPIGAKNVWDAYTKGQITMEDARRMAVFCNNAGPSFLFGILGAFFSDRLWVWTLWFIQIIGALVTGMVLPGGSIGCVTNNVQTKVDLSDIFNRSLRSMASVCGWVTLFRMILEFLNRWILWLFPVPVQVLLTGILELSNGCICLGSVESMPIRFLLASVMLSMGGICILMQTKSVFPRLNIKEYLFGKLLQCAICIVLSITAVLLISRKVPNFLLPVVCVLFITLFWAVSRKRKKEVAIP